MLLRIREFDDLCMKSNHAWIVRELIISFSYTSLNSIQIRRITQFFYDNSFFLNLFKFDIRSLHIYKRIIYKCLPACQIFTFNFRSQQLKHKICQFILRITSKLLYILVMFSWDIATYTGCFKSLRAKKLKKLKSLYFSLYWAY